MNRYEKRKVHVLAVLPDAGDQSALREIFDHSNWTLRIVDNYHDAVRILSTNAFGVVITDTNLGTGCDWKGILNAALSTAVPVPVIVTDRLASERLWAEVLNLCGYDVLPKPFAGMEVYRIVSAAWRSWLDQCGLATQGQLSSSQTQCS